MNCDGERVETLLLPQRTNGRRHTIASALPILTEDRSCPTLHSSEGRSGGGPFDQRNLTSAQPIASEASGTSQRQQQHNIA
jgi:hypothetical protein